MGCILAWDICICSENLLSIAACDWHSSAGDPPMTFASGPIVWITWLYAGRQLVFPYESAPVSIMSIFAYGKQLLQPCCAQTVEDKWS